MTLYPEEFLDAVCAALRERQRPAGRPTLIGIDGPGCSGKSVLSDELLERLKGEAIAIGLDDFFIPLSQQSLSWMPTEDLSLGVPHLRWMDIERVVLDAFARGNTIAYRPYLWDEDTVGAEICVTPSAIVLVEGLYALHPRLRSAYDFTIWVDSRQRDRMARVRARGSGNLQNEHRTRLLRLWDELYVPREQSYLSSYRPYEFANFFVLGVGLERAKTDQTFAWLHASQRPIEI